MTAKLIDEANLGKQKDISEEKQKDWIKNASNTVSTNETILHDLTLDYEHFMNNVRTAGAIYNMDENVMLEEIKKNYQAKLRWEARQDEIVNSSPDFNSVLQSIGCKPKEIQDNLNLALQTKTRSQIKYEKKRIPIMIEEDGKEIQATVDQNIEIVTLDESDKKHLQKLMIKWR